MELQDHLGYSNERLPARLRGYPLARRFSSRGLGKAGTRLIGDVKFKDPLSSNVEDIGWRGAFVGFGNTACSAARADGRLRPRAVQSSEFIRLS